MCLLPSRRSLTQPAAFLVILSRGGVQILICDQNRLPAKVGHPCVGMILYGFALELQAWELPATFIAMMAKLHVVVPLVM